MQIACPHCSFSREVPDDQVPDRPVRATCPKCRQGFSFDKSSLLATQDVAAQSPATTSGGATGEDQVTCPACGLRQAAGVSCVGCGVIYAKWQARREADETDRPARPAGDGQPGRRIVCHACGTVQPPASHCASCGAMIVVTASEVEGYQFAGFWIRSVAYVIDSLIIGGMQLVLGLLLGFAIGSLGGFSVEGDSAMSTVTWLFGAALGIAYAVFFIGYCGQTPGKMALRIKVIRSDGSAISYGRAALREVPGKFLSSILLGIGYLMVAFDRRKQGLHDKIAGTYVVKL